jgi:hypothetical protein
MKSLLFIAAFAIGLLAFLVATQPVSAARGWWSWPNSGYCPSGTCNKLGGFSPCVKHGAAVVPINSGSIPQPIKRTVLNRYSEVPP